VTAKIDDPQERLAGARRAIDWLATYLLAVNADLERLDRSIAARLVEIRQPPPAGTECNSENVHAGGALPAYFGLRLEQSSTRGAVRICRALLSDIKALSDELTAFGRELEQFAASASRSAAAEAGGCDAARSATHDDLAAWLRMRLGQLAAEVDARLERECLAEQGGLWDTIMQGGRRRAQLSATLQESAKQVVRTALSQINVLEEQSAGGWALDQAALRSSLAVATPTLLELGGTRRVLAVLPCDSAGPDVAARLTNTLGLALSTTPAPDNSLTLCVEAGEIPIEQVAAGLVQRRRDRIEFARRVHSRTDIAWAPLLPEPAADTPFTWSDAQQPALLADHAVDKTMVI
jgi:hypothetical protein